MISFVLRRALLVIPAFIGVTLLTFALVHLIPGDPVLMMAGERGISPERHAELMAQLGLDQPLWRQYVTYLEHAIQGDLGKSVVTRKPVVEEFLTLFPATLELGICAITFAVLLGIPAGVLAAVKRGTIFDHGVMVVSLTGYSMPIFWWGLLLIMLVSGILGWTPVSGRMDPTIWMDSVTGFMLIDSLLTNEPGAFSSAVRHLILPAFVVGTIPLAVIARMTRSAMLEVLSEDYVRTARAKGVSPLKVVMVHALRNALIPVITVIGLQVGILLANAILTETIFAWPGVGKWLVESINRRDYPSVQGGVLLVATVVILLNLLVDVLYGVVNPRIRHRR
ncbi:ABC transporter permease subunit [Rhodospirillum sp. A1_3_36]|uniref:ABC transporter permease subunit n=1 Tax=Rhodospirillum sp. A1_3_36 TaxID=3391666 RepID=UPI0039A6FACE